MLGKLFDSEVVLTAIPIKPFETDRVRSIISDLGTDFSLC